MAQATNERIEKWELVKASTIRQVAGVWTAITAERLELVGSSVLLVGVQRYNSALTALRLQDGEARKVTRNVSRILLRQNASVLRSSRRTPTSGLSCQRGETGQNGFLMEWLEFAPIVAAILLEE